MEKSKNTIKHPQIPFIPPLYSQNKKPQCIVVTL